MPTVETPATREHVLASDATESGVRPDVLLGYVEAGASVVEAVECERARCQPIPKPLNGGGR